MRIYSSKLIQVIRLLASVAGVLLVCLAGCKPQTNSLETGARGDAGSAQDALNLSSIEARDRVHVSDETQIRVAIAKRILGLNPDRDDRHDHIGLMNLADLMGFMLPYNDCNQPWRVTEQGDEISVTSHHHRGVGQNCQIREPDPSVIYTLKDWALAPEAVETKRWAAVPEATAWPKPFANSNAHTSSAVAASVDDEGILHLTVKETAVASVTAQDEAFIHRVKYERTMRAEPEFQKLWRPAEYGLQIVPGIGGGASFTLGTTRPGSTRLERLSCAANVLQPPGCLYRVTLAVEHKIKQKKYRAMISLIPQVAALAGRLIPSMDCKYRPNRRADGSCGDAAARAGAIVTDSFGQAGDLHFGEALTQLVAEHKGNWLWSHLRGDPLAQKDGIPTLDWALRYFADESFGNLSFDFASVTESIEACSLKVETLPGSAPNCQSMQDGAAIEPVKVPII